MKTASVKIDQVIFITRYHNDVIRQRNENKQCVKDK